MSFAFVVVNRSSEGRRRWAAKDDSNRLSTYLLKRVFLLNDTIIKRYILWSIIIEEWAELGSKGGKYAGTNKDLLDHALAPAMKWLIAAALDGTTMTYGEVKHRLETEANFSTVFATRIGLVAGGLMNRIQQVEPKAPLINVLVVNQSDRLPSKGAGAYMATRFANPRLKADSYKKHYPGSWKSHFERAAAEIYAFRQDEWLDLYRRVFGQSLSANEIDAERNKRQAGNENDFGAGSNKYGTGGEGNYHKSLRIWVTENPHKVRAAFTGARTETEFNLDSGDRVDSVYHLQDRTIVVEVKSRISNTIDLRRGVFQCIKYRAVKQAMDVRDNALVEAILVTEDRLPGEIEALLKCHKILHFQAPKNRD